jgi:hypothetical protein
MVAHSGEKTPKSEEIIGESENVDGSGTIQRLFVVLATKNQQVPF